MPSLLQSTANTRTVLPGNLRLLRSDAPLSPTAADIAYLLDHGVTNLIDLRSKEELQRKPCPLAADARFTYHHMPVTGGNAMPSSVEDVPRSYLRMVDAQIREILRVICESDGVMYFCTAGKDRTGVVSALIQREHGMSDDAIASEYAISAENLQERFTAFHASHPDINVEIYTPKKEYMLLFLSLLK